MNYTCLDRILANTIRSSYLTDRNEQYLKFRKFSLSVSNYLIIGETMQQQQIDIHSIN